MEPRTAFLGRPRKKNARARLCVPPQAQPSRAHSRARALSAVLRMGLFGGAFWWGSFVGLFCGAFWWGFLVGLFDGAFWWVFLVGLSGVFWWGFLVGLFGGFFFLVGAFWWGFLVGLFGGAFWWGLLVIFFGGAFCWDFLVGLFGGAFFREGPERESNPQRRRYIGDGHQARANKVAHALNR